jgi:2-polyprenyl-6-methoxyphenol hydroxylase-like FAD-dependent oxidoreductase
LEKENDIVEDPRGVYLAADAIRILYALGLGDVMPKIGHGTLAGLLHVDSNLIIGTDNQSVHFHSSSFANPPYHTIDAHKETLQQAVPAGILQIQPALGKSHIPPNDIIQIHPKAGD